MSLPIKKYISYLPLFLFGFITASFLIFGGLFFYAMLNFHMPGDGPLYSFAGWRDDLSTISAVKIDRRSQPLPYTLIDIDGKDEKEEYHSSISVNALLNAPARDASPSELAATCAAGVKYYAEKYHSKKFGPDAVHFIIYEKKPDATNKNGLILADCLYSPDGVGWDSREDHPWKWMDLRVRERPFTEKELEVKNALAEMNTPNAYIKAGQHDPFWARDNVGRLTGMSYDEVFEIETFKNKVLFPASIFKNIKAQGPVSNK